MQNKTKQSKAQKTVTTTTTTTNPQTQSKAKQSKAKQALSLSLSLSLSPVCILFACLLDCCHIASLLGGFLSIHSHQLSSCKIQKRQ